MSHDIVKILRAERGRLGDCAERFLKKAGGNAAVQSALERYARRIPGLFFSYAESGDRRLLRRALAEHSARLAEAGVSFAVAERFFTALHHCLRDLIYGGLREDASALRKALLLKDRFFEDVLGSCFKALTHWEAERIRETEKRHADFFESTIFPAFLATGKQVIRKVNQAFLDHFGGRAETYRGKSVCEMLDAIGVCASDIRSYRRRLREKGLVRDLSMTGRCCKGETAYLEISSMFTRSARGQVTGFQGMIHNITAHVAPQIALQKAMERLKRHGQTAKRVNRTLKAVYESSPGGLVFVNPGNEISMMNGKASEILGFCMSSEESHAPAGPHFSAFAHGLRNARELLELLDRIGREPTLRATGVCEVLDPARFIQYETLPVTDAKGNCQGRLWVLLDITRQVEAERMKQDLTHMIVHDLKNPLTALSGAAQILRMQLPDPPASVLQTLEVMDRNASTMMRMIGNLLNIHRLEAHEIEPDRRPVAVEPFVRETIEAMRGLQGSRKVRMFFLGKAGLPAILADADLIGRVLSNLFSNAVKHTDPGKGIIRIGVRDLKNGFVEISVSDNGEGIPVEYHARIFEKFQQVPKHRKGAIADTGLGLAFCKLAVMAHGGCIGVKSTPGRGSRFYFTLPTAAPASEAAP